MGKQGKDYLKRFKDKFYELNKKLDKKQFLTYYLIAAHPGCNEKDMMDLKVFASAELKINPEQVQIFTPTPSTYSTLMYYTEINPFTMKKLFVEKDNGKKERQKSIIVPKDYSYSKKKKGNNGSKNNSSLKKENLNKKENFKKKNNLSRNKKKK